MKRTLESRAFVSAILAMAIGTFLFYAHPFPDEQIFLRVIAVRAPQAFLSFKYLYCVLLFTTPYLVCSTVLSGLYIFTLKARQAISPGRLPKYPDPSKRDDLFLVVGEVRNPRKPVPAKAPSWLTIPERGLFTGIAILGAIGSGKTSCCMLPFIATQSISSLRSALPGESWRTLLQTFRTKIFLSLSDDFSASTASHLCGHEDQIKVSYSLSESGHDTKVSWLTGKALSHKANIIASKSYNTQSDYRFDMKTFMELRNAQSVVIAYDGIKPTPPMFC